MDDGRRWFTRSSSVSVPFLLWIVSPRQALSSSLHGILTVLTVLSSFEVTDQEAAEEEGELGREVVEMVRLFRVGSSLALLHADLDPFCSSFLTGRERTRGRRGSRDRMAASRA